MHIENVKHTKDMGRRTYSVTTTTPSKSVEQQLMRTRNAIGKKLISILDELGSFKFREILEVELEKPLTNDSENIEACFSSKQEVINNSLDIGLELGESSRDVERAMGKIIASYSTFVSQGSGFVFRGITNHEFNVIKHSPIGSGIPMERPFASGNLTSIGGSYIPTPEKRAGKNTRLINIRNEDNKCFMWCHARHLRYAAGEKITKPT